MYRYNGRQRRYTLGTYPQLGLADARELANSALHQAAMGEDPAGQKQASHKAPTFRELAEQYLEAYAKQRKRSWPEAPGYCSMTCSPPGAAVRLMTSSAGM